MFLSFFWLSSPAQYFVDYKLGADYTGQGSLWYASDFMNYLGFAAQVPNFFFSWLNIFVQLG